MYYDETVQEVFKKLQSGKEGITHEDAHHRLRQHGPNELKATKKDSKLALFLRQFKSFIIYILFAATLISALLGEYLDAGAIFVILILNAVLGFVQEYKAEKSIEALRKMASLKARVIRNGKETQLDVKELVPGDLILLNPGDKVPADARVFEAVQLECNEAALTGESNTTTKTTGSLKAKTVLGDRTNMVFSGTIITEGRGKAIVTGTGMKSEIGKIAGMIQKTVKSATPLQKKLSVLGKKIAWGVLAISIIVFATGVVTGGVIIEMFMAAVSLAVAAIPEGLPAVVTITLAIGTKKMVKRNALIRKLPSVETLGSTSVICTDKTGTLTHNQMTVQKLFVDNTVIEVSGSGYTPEGTFSKKLSNDLILRIGALCNDAQLLHENNSWTVTGDPTEGCLLTVAEKAHLDVEALRKAHPRLNEIMFDSARKRMTTIHNVKGNVAYVKGAPDSILQVCNRILVNGKVRPLTQKDRKTIMDYNDRFSRDALRVLGFAYRPLRKGEKETDKKTVEKDLIFVGLQGMIDPPRQEVKQAVTKCKRAGIKVVMITGDYKVTAKAIAKAIGIEGKAIDGSELEHIDLDKEVEQISIYSRVNPEDKMRIVAALKKKGHVVAMTGDGVNDAPALKQSDIGIAMGITGTDVAKEASDMILTDDNFSSIVNAVEEGRGVYSSIKQFVQYTLSSNFGEILVIFLAILIGWPLPLVAIQILWVNLVTDGLPGLSLGLDPYSKDLMNQPPRKRKESMISREVIYNIFIVGIVMGIGTLFMFHSYGIDTAKAKSVAFTTLIMFQLFNVLTYRAKHFVINLKQSKYLVGSVVISVLMQLAVLYIPVLNTVLKTVPLSVVDWGKILLVSFSLYLIIELRKLVMEHREQKKTAASST